MFVPRGTPASIIERLNTTINKLLEEDEMKKGLAGQGMLPRARTPAGFDEIVRKDYARWSRVVKDIGFKPD